MPISAITQRQQGLQQRIGRSLFASISLAMLFSVGFSGWSILRDYQSSIEQHQRSMTSLSRALEGYSSTLLKQSYESVRVSGKELARQQLGKDDSEAILAVLRTAMRYDSVSRYLFARVEGQLFIIDVTGQPVHDQALHDPLTGLFNRRYLIEFFQREQARALRERTSLALAMIDLDHFKRLNDSHGHLVGDEVLQAVAQHLQDNLRSTDAVFRIGGEEFLLILPDAELDEAVSRVDGLRAQLAASPLPTRAGALSVTLSAGVALWPNHGHTLEELMQAADRALYQAKRDGRDRVQVSQS